ncbi:MAG TPA: hypothetical protein VJS69_02120, partial [Candidatus Krumholzibacteria bacterium]|nr:hypothetical protein [Candidatus Krumholzibacteria bacterium]
ERPHAPPREIDSTGTIWGDEYEGLAIDGGETVRTRPRGIHVEHTDGATQSTRLDALARGVSAHARSYPSGEVGSVSWRGAGVVREITVGDFSPAIAEGALMGDPRTGGDLRPSPTARISGLSMRPSTSTWSSMRGAGAILGENASRVSLSAWEAKDDARSRVGMASFERLMRGGMLGVAGATTGDKHAAGSIYGARDTEKMFATAELALSQGRVRGVTRVVAGNMSAIAIAGAGPASDAPLVFARKERWGAALERHDGWGWGASRTGVSTLTRRDVVSDIRRRRAFWDGAWRIDDDTELELAARVTREENTRAASGALAGLPLHEVADDWRARATVRAQRGLGSGWLTENAYRLEWVENRSGKPGIVASWVWRMHASLIDTKLSASAHALGPGQVSYSTDSAPPGLVEYSAVTGKGASLAASFRLGFKRHAWLEAAWSQTPPRPQRMWITLGART